MTEKPYRQIEIRECGEILTPIPEGLFVLTDPPPYKAVGADYGDSSPWMLRTGVLAALQNAQEILRQKHKGWSIRIHDAYRPNAVQRYMVEREYSLLAQEKGWDPSCLTQGQRESLTPRVWRVWAIPSDDPKTPPPHSTGAVVDCTLTDETGRDLFMGSPLDENSPRSDPDHFKESDPIAHANRQELLRVMTEAGFARHPQEWWHFSQGDQLWAWLQRMETGRQDIIARYGSAASFMVR